MARVGAVPTTIDRESLALIAGWLREAAVPPPYPFPIDPALAKRGRPLYQRFCAECHGASGRGFSGERVGEVEPIARLGADPCRLDNHSAALALEQGNLYAGIPELRFRRFRKTDGYANMPLDGLWLRAPYLHNGSVPTLEALLSPPQQRPEVFYRGVDLLDLEAVGFVATGLLAEAQGYRFDTRLRGNGNGGHAYGTHLAPAERSALVEYLKTL